MAAVYETPELLAQYLHFHYADPEEFLPWPDGPRGACGFPRRCAELLAAAAGAVQGGGRFLDLGCAVGGASFHLSARAEAVLGIDFSEAFVGAARQLATTGRLPYRFPEEGAQEREHTARLPEGARPDRVEFRKGDACALPADLGVFDGVLLANLLCRLPDPAACLRRLAGLTRAGGAVLITTPCSWSTAYTPPRRWLCAGGPTLEGIRALLEPDFSLESSMDLPFLIREHGRKYQWTVAQASLWRRR